MTDEQKEDIRALIEELSHAFTEASDGEAALVSKVGSRFHQRVERLMSTLVEDKLL